MESQIFDFKKLLPNEVAVVMVPLPAQGHLNQLLHLAHLITSYGIPVHFAGSESHNHQAKLRVHGWDAENLIKIHFHDFQLPPYDISPSAPSNLGHCIPFPAHFHPLFQAATHLQEPVSKLLWKFSTKFSRIIVIHDILMASVVQEVQNIPNAESYSQIPISAFSFFLGFWENLTDKPFELDSKDIPECNIPSTEGCTPPEIDEFVANQFKFMGLESGRLYNTSRPVEGRYVELLQKMSPADIKHFVLGPFNPMEFKTGSGLQKRHQCLEWLDEQEQGSVIYVSFGSSTSLNNEQIRELANGLEGSGQKFVWVLRNCDTGDVFDDGEVKRPQLPEGYEDRVKNRGIVVRDWAPQLEVLAHSSVGGFMSHCGWNSCIESISMGVAIAAWPMHSEQPNNALLVTDILRIGTLVRDWAHRSRLVTSTTIENAVRTLMVTAEGYKMRKRAAELGDAVRQSVAKGGTAHKEMDSFVAHITGC